MPSAANLSDIELDVDVEENKVELDSETPTKMIRNNSNPISTN